MTGFSGSISVVGIVAEERFELRSLQSQGLITIDNNLIQASIPETVFKTAAGAPAIASFPESATYRNLVDFRELQIIRTDVSAAESFDPAIWDPR